MTREVNQGPPDLGDILLKLFQPLLNLYTRLSAKLTALRHDPLKHSGDHGRKTPNDTPLSFPANKQSSQPSITKKPAITPLLRKEVRSVEVKPPPLAAQLRDHNFLRRAIVVNEILAKPVALRRR